MVTQKQLMASRANGRLAAGPRTTVGKAASRVNAAKHGLCAQLPTLAVCGETPEAWAAHREAVLLDLDPAGPVQAALAERVALLVWRLRRCALADTAAAAVALQAAAAVETPPADPIVPDPGACRVKELRRQLAAARDRAAAHHRATELAERLDDAPDDEGLDAGTTRALLAAALRARNMDVIDWSEHIALEVLQQEGGSPDLALDRRFEGWTVRRLRAALAHLAAGKGPAAMVATAVRNWAPHLARERDGEVRALEGAVAAAAGEQVASRVEPALAKAAAGTEALQCVTRYEKAISAELGRTLTLYFALRAAGPTRAAEAVDGEEVD